MKKIIWLLTSCNIYIYINDKLQTSALVEELNRVSAENKKLSEMLTLMCDNYNVLRKQLMEYVNKSNITERDQISPPKKRKSPAREDAFSCAVIGGVSESSSTDQDEYLCKKQREETVVKEKVSRVYYKTEASDTTLVSIHENDQTWYLSIFRNFILYGLLIVEVVSYRL
ncbi:hypothetical protein AXX17_AT1G75740 [Arabidopsis thaliana]|uniref:Uncharacterized protein n=1 Tax=Arabidopsis thaliana TaxID=3702 RepID=A0A178WAK2_ARATH|nr:hypothetical protein AXX17_AT1G75740 [Arabidopsis thaliana]